MKNGTQSIDDLEVGEYNQSSESISADAVKGDVIGSTAYSQRFVLNCLIKLNQGEIVESANEFIEKDLCTLWDMTTEKDVAQFLIEHNALDIFHAILVSSNNGRLLEIALGTISNISCHKEVIHDIKQKRAFVINIFSHLRSADPMILVQVLRFTLTSIYNDSTGVKFWLDCLKVSDFPLSLRYIFENSMNEDVLVNGLETLNCICSACDDDNKKIFIQFFVDQYFVTSLITGFQEILNCMEDSSSAIKETEERCHVIFLAIMWTVINFEECSLLFSDESNEMLFTHSNMIVEKAWKNENEGLVDLVEYVTGISSSLNFPLYNSSTKVCRTFMTIWKNLIDSCNDGNIKKPDFEYVCFIDSMKSEITPVLANYFVRMIKLWPMEKVHELFEDFDERHILKLQSSIEECIENKVIDKYYSDVSCTLNSLIESIKK